MLKVKSEDDRVIINKEDFEQFIEDLSSTLETLEILSDSDLMEQLKRSEQDIKEGRVYEIKDEKSLRKLLDVENV